MTRAEHLAWAKKRALDYLDDDDKTSAIASIMSDLRKHDGWSTASLTLCFAICPAGGTAEQVRKWIEGFN